MKNKVSFCFVWFSPCIPGCPVELALSTWLALDSEICKPLLSMLVLKVHATTHHQADGSFAGTPAFVPRYLPNPTPQNGFSFLTCEMGTAQHPYDRCWKVFSVPPALVAASPHRVGSDLRSPLWKSASSAPGKAAHLIRVFACHAQLNLGFSS